MSIVTMRAGAFKSQKGNMQVNEFTMNALMARGWNDWLKKETDLTLTSFFWYWFGQAMAEEAVDARIYEFETELRQLGGYEDELEEMENFH